MAVSCPTPDQIDAARRFTRFYTRHLRLLGDRLLDSDFSLSESRILYELAQRESTTAAMLGRDLGLDPGYLSRTLKKLEGRGIVARTLSDLDRRESNLALTEAGRADFATLDAASANEVAGLLMELDDGERTELIRAMRTIRRLLGDPGGEPRRIALRPPRTGDIGWIAHRQGLLYAKEYGWDASFEALVAQIAADFVAGFDPDREQCWIAEVDGEIAGSVFLVAETDAVAKLRLLYVEPFARGLGLGRQLVETCITAARDKGYAKLTLWTNDVLAAARTIYLGQGFRLVSEERHHSFGHDLVGQFWELDL